MGKVIELGNVDSYVIVVNNRWQITTDLAGWRAWQKMTKDDFSVEDFEQFLENNYNEVLHL